MEIAGVLAAGKLLSSALELLPKLGQSQETAEGRSRDAPVTSVGTGAGAPPALGEIVAEYDVTEISPRDFSEMVRKLYQAGALSDHEFQELSAIRVDLDLQGVDPDETLNLLDFCLQKLRALQRSPDESRTAGQSLAAGSAARVACARRRLQWVEKFAAIQAGPDSAGLDALA